MAKPYPTLPLSVLDDLNTLNASLMAYQYAVEGIIRRVADEGRPERLDTLIAGLDQLAEPILEGYRDISAQVEQFRQLGTVSILVIPD